jgi:hypothetical protein
MHDDTTPPGTTGDDHTGRYRTIDFADGLLIFDRKATAGWIQSDVTVPLADSR